jgi:hypothetical protein
MRERMQVHRATPACAGCHQLLDPLGFAMENFDAVGAWRTVEAGRKVDATSELMDGSSVDGTIELREMLLADPRVFAGMFTEKLLIYALGRGLQYYDMPIVRGLLDDARDTDYRFSGIVLGIVESVPFQQRVSLASDDSGA